MKKRDKEMLSWMEEKKIELAPITDEEERIEYFRKIIMPQMKKIEKKEKRSHHKHRADFDMSLLDRGFDIEDDFNVSIPSEITISCMGKTFEEIIFSQKPEDLHELVSDGVLSMIIKNRSLQQKEMIFYIDIYGYSGTDVAKWKDTSERNLTAIHNRGLDHIRGQILPIILHKFKLEHSEIWSTVAHDRNINTRYTERKFAVLLGEKYKDYYGKPSNINLIEITKFHNEQVRLAKIRRNAKKKIRKLYEEKLLLERQQRIAEKKAKKEAEKAANSKKNLKNILKYDNHCGNIIIIDNYYKRRF